MKKNKWFIIFVIVIVLLVLGVSILASLKDDDLTITRKLSSTAWWNSKETYYENDIVVETKTQFDPPYYVIFNKETVRYCNGQIQECNEYPYVYKNKKDKIIVKIEKVDYFIPKGTYEVSFGDNMLILINNSNNKKVVYELVGAIG